MNDEVRYQLTRTVAASATRVRDVLLAHPLPARPDRSGPDGQDFPLGTVLDALAAELNVLLRAVADYPRPLAHDPDTGARSGTLAHLLARLTAAMADAVVRFHGQDHLRGPAVEAEVLDRQLRDVRVAATLLLAEVGPLELDVQRRAQALPAHADPRWRAALIAAAAHAEPVWARASQPDQNAHILGLEMLAIALYVTGAELGRDPADIDAVVEVSGLLSPVARDPLWGPRYFQRLAAVNSRASGDELAWEVDARNERVDELRSRIEYLLDRAGVDRDAPAREHRDLVQAWRDLLLPAPESSDLTINGPAYTWRPHLPEGALRAMSYLHSDRAVVSS